ncbi:hypothetical protein MMC17_006900 [Xylographa soralifera]|nr:hypothetical protein [Xylographa soralifera]
MQLPTTFQNIKGRWNTAYSHVDQSASWLTWGLSNSEILGSSYSPTIIELGPPKRRTLEKVHLVAQNILGHVGQGAAGQALWRLQNLQHIDHRLPDTDPSSRNVFLVCRSNTAGGHFRFDSPSKHWSIYSQGHFFHLNAPAKPAQLSGVAQEFFQEIEIKPYLKHEDLSTPETDDYKRFMDISGIQKPMLALNVGQTDYLPHEIFALAEWVIARMTNYSIYSASCQHFALRMLVRTVMRLGDRSAFLGSTMQIVDWDMRGSSVSPDHYRSIESGFCVHAPIPIKSLNFKESIRLDVQQIIESYQMVLKEQAYKHGQQDFPDYYSLLRYRNGQMVKRVKESTEKLSNSLSFIGGPR